MCIWLLLQDKCNTPAYIILRFTSNVESSQQSWNHRNWDQWNITTQTRDYAQILKKRLCGRNSPTVRCSCHILYIHTGTGTHCVCFQLGFNRLLWWNPSFCCLCCSVLLWRFFLMVSAAAGFAVVSLWRQLHDVIMHQCGRRCHRDLPSHCLL